jgi:hypothetical protein
VDFGLQMGKILVVIRIEEWLLCIMQGTESARVLCVSPAVARLAKPSRDRQVRILTSRFTTYFYFFNPAHIRRDGVKEDYYV